MTGKELIERYRGVDYSKPMHNSMGCSENWYDPVFSIYNTFTEEEILNMNEKEVDNLIKLSENISEGLY